MTDAIPTDELDATLAQLEQAGLVEQYVNDDGEATDEAGRAGRQPAGNHVDRRDDDVAALLEA
jgi:hypothetical protein